MKTITIYDPVDVGKMIDAEFAQAKPNKSHSVSFERGKFSCLHWYGPSDYFLAIGSTPEDLAAEIRRLLDKHDPLAKLRKQAEAAGYSMVANKSALRDSDCYALFSGHCYYPWGGAGDFRGWGSIEDLKEIYANNAGEWSMESPTSHPESWGQIAHRETMIVIMTVRGHNDWFECPQHAPAQPPR